MQRSFAGDVLQQFSERFAERQNLPRSPAVKSGPAFSIGAFAADLNHAHDFFAGENRGADNFLNGFGGFGAGLHAFKYAGVSAPRQNCC